VFAAALCAVDFLDLHFRKRSSGAGDSIDFSGFDFGGGDDGD